MKRRRSARARDRIRHPIDRPILHSNAITLSLIVEMNHPGVWVLGDLDDEDRKRGMGIVVEYAGRSGQGVWIAPAKAKWNYGQFAKAGTTAAPDQTFEMTFAKDNAAEEGFNR